MKYFQRNGWSMRDLLRLSHPITKEIERLRLIDWIAHPKKTEAIVSARAMFRLIDNKCRVSDALYSASAAQAIREYLFPHEAVPTKYLGDEEVWNALLINMPMKAMIRNLAKMTQVHIIARHRWLRFRSASTGMTIYKRLNL